MVSVNLLTHRFLLIYIYMRYFGQYHADTKNIIIYYSYAMLNNKLSYL